MRKIEEYKRHADECRQLAAISSNEETRAQLLEMAQTWTELARNREDQIVRHERIDALEIKNDSSA
jgi:hypothetical protein